MKKHYLVLSLILTLSFPALAQKIVFSPQWIAQAQFAGYYVAQEKGFYKEAGLDVEIVHPSTSSSVFNKLKTGQSDIVTLQLLDAMIIKDQGLDIVNVMQFFQNSMLVIVAQPQYTSLEQLEGKKIGGWKSGFCQLAMCMSNDNNHKIEWVFFNSGISVFTSNAVDAILSMYYNEYFQLINCGKRITKDNCFHLSDYEEYNIPEDGLFCLRDVYESRKSDLKLFAEASKKGWEYARNNPDETLEIVYKIMEKDNIPISKAQQAWMLQKILDAMVDKETNAPSYQLKPEMFKRANDMLLRNGFIKHNIEYQDFVPSLN
ncbi:MAG: ABC transporter substrate-binding protein [Bacteroidales bacterium]|jgi:NitT/TauT family transport system substrate-binding protein|nr:ABC transporter substrate-binding protein [Bacteroidales bacterium]MDD3151639.1 ABC transporter substrate-binding protein [Bacteroidales bacterium]MDD3914026.1 ABC transporter substrate-binding protein [Bacteroidales bacterium]MDD4633876.1 ABC transporter substrate-binding protein [Bacteroidales bacterium]